jgi:serine/threonine protein kinase
VPEYVPTGASDLIKKMIVRDTEKRISMEGVRHHYWVMEGHAEPPVDLAIPRETPIHNIDREVRNKNLPAPDIIIYNIRKLYLLCFYLSFLLLIFFN